MNAPHRMRSVPLAVPSRPPEGAGRILGQILVESGRLSADDADRIAKFQLDSPARFGERHRRGTRPLWQWSRRGPTGLVHPNPQ